MIKIGDGMKKKMKKLFNIFITFLRIGAFTFGGGYAMIPLINKEAVEKNKWVSDDDILDIIAISESTPGPISVNAATFIGYKVAGFWGAFFATLGLILPAFIIMFLLSFVLRKVKDIKIIEYAFFGIRAGVLALIINALIKMYKQVDKNFISYFIIILSLILSVFVDMNAIIVIIICGLIGLVSSLYIGRRDSK
jgi:chromate transporter